MKTESQIRIELLEDLLGRTHCPPHCDPFAISCITNGSETTNIYHHPMYGVAKTTQPTKEKQNDNT